MEHEEGKKSPHKTPYTQLEEVNSDFIQGIGLQEQDGTFTMLTTLESETESSFDDDDDDDDGDDEGDNADFFQSQEFQTDLQFLESEGINYDEDMEEFGIDVDELTYDELIELGDFTGKEKIGLSTNEIPSRLHSNKFHSAKSKGRIDRCVICQIEYEEGEALVTLHCEHPYHTDCISKWLQIKKVCPICSSEISVPKMVKNP